MQTLTESLHDQEQQEGCAYSDGYRDVLESVQELGFSHRAQEEGADTTSLTLSFGPHIRNWLQIRKVSR